MQNPEYEKNLALMKEFQECATSMIKVVREMPIAYLADLSMSKDHKKLVGEVTTCFEGWKEIHKLVDASMEETGKRVAAFNGLMNHAVNSVSRYEKQLSSPAVRESIGALKELAVVCNCLEDIAKRGVLSKVLSIIGRKGEA